MLNARSRPFLSQPHSQTCKFSLIGEFMEKAIVKLNKLATARPPRVKFVCEIRVQQPEIHSPSVKLL